MNTGHNHITALQTILISYGFDSYGFHIEGNILRWRDPCKNIHEIMKVDDRIRGISVNLAVDYHMPRLVITTITNIYHANYDGWVKFDNDPPESLYDEY